MRQDANRRHPRKTRPGGRRAERGAGGKRSRRASAAAAWPTCDLRNVNESRREWECPDRLWHRSEGREFSEKSWMLINRHKQGCRLCSTTLFGHRFGGRQISGGGRVKNLIRCGMTSSKGSENINTCCPSLWDRRHKASVSGNCFQEMLHDLQLLETLQNKSYVTFYSFSAILFAVLVLYHYRLGESREVFFYFASTSLRDKAPGLLQVLRLQRTRRWEMCCYYENGCRSLRINFHKLNMQTCQQQKYSFILFMLQLLHFSIIYLSFC